MTLVGLAPLPSASDAVTNTLAQASSLLIQLVTVIGALALILGIINLLVVHVHKLSSGINGLYSFVTLLAAVLVVAVHIADRAGVFKTLEPTGGTGDFVSLTVMDAVQVAIESALAGLLTFFLVYAAFRLLRKRLSGWNVLFLAALILVLIGYIPISNVTGLSDIRDWLLRVPVTAGTRGILIGVALGTLITGIRLLFGQDRLFRE